MKFFLAELKDRDGEQHMYCFESPDAWKVTEHIAKVMSRDGDFYGHKREETIEISVGALIAKPEYPIHTITL